MNKFDILEMIKMFILTAFCSVGMYSIVCICFQWQLTPLDIIEVVELSVITNVLLTIWSKGKQPLLFFILVFKYIVSNIMQLNTNTVRKYYVVKY